MLVKRNVVTLLMVAALASFTALPATAQERIPVVATFSILGDLVSRVGGDRIDLTTLVGPDGDGHVYSPTPADARRVAEARLVVTNGLEFEGWIDRLIASSGTDAKVIAASDSIAAIAEEEDEDDDTGHDHGHAKGHSHGHSHGHDRKDAHNHSHDHAQGRDHAGHEHGEFDPHAWQDVDNVKAYVANIRDALVEIDPEGAEAYAENAEGYLAELADLEKDIEAAVASIPEDRRKVITTHDAFAYFSRAYGLEFIAPQGVSTESEASARDVGEIIRQIRELGVRAVFVENISDPRLIERISAETGAQVGGTLYSDALSPPEGPAGTYIEMMRHNIRVLSEALAS